MTSGICAMKLHVIVGDRTVSSCDLTLAEVREQLRVRFQMTHFTIEFGSGSCRLDR